MPLGNDIGLPGNPDAVGLRMREHYWDRFGGWGGFGVGRRRRILRPGILVLGGSGEVTQERNRAEYPNSDGLTRCLCKDHSSNSAGSVLGIPIKGPLILNFFMSRLDE